MSASDATNSETSSEPSTAPPSDVPPTKRGCIGGFLYFLKRITEGFEAIFRWLLAYPLLTLQLVLLYLVAWGGLGWEVGLEHLFWHEGWLLQFGTGITVGMLTGVILFLNYILYRPEWLVGPGKPDPKKPGILAKFPGTLFPSDVTEVRQLGKFLFWMKILAFALFIVPKLIVACSSKDPGFVGYMAERRWLVPFVLGYVFSDLFAYFLFLCDERWHFGSKTSYRECFLDYRIVPCITEDGLIRCTVRDYLSRPHTEPLAKEELPLHGIAGFLLFVASCILGLLLLTVATIDDLKPGFSLTGLVSLVALVLIVFSMVYGFFAFHLHVQRVVFGVVVILLIIWNSTSLYPENNYKLRFPGMDYSRTTPLWDPSAQGEARDVFTQKVLPKSAAYAEDHLIDSEVPLAAMAEEWQETNPGQKPKVVVICTTRRGI